MIIGSKYALLLCSLAALYGQAERPATTVLHVVGWTTEGERLDNIWVVLSSVDGRQRYTANGHNVDLRVPTGDYILTVEAPGFRTKQQMIRASGATVLRSVALPVAPLHGQPTARLTGTVRGYNGQMQDLRVTLLNLYGAESRESTVDKTGVFGFPVDEGRYLLLVLAEGEGNLRILASKPVHVRDHDKVEIDVNPKQATLVP